MAGRFSDTVIGRLPACVQALDEASREIYIYLRLRKDEHEIARLIGLSVVKVRLKAMRVRDELAKACLLYHVEDPRLVSIHDDDTSSERIPLISKDPSPETKAMASEFMTHLKDTVDGLADSQSKLLRLRYNHAMTAGEIREFAERLNIVVVPGKPPHELNEQDVFYALSVAIKEVLAGLKERSREESDVTPEGLKTIFELIEI